MSFLRTHILKIIAACCRAAYLLPLAGLYRIAYKLHHHIFLRPGKPLAHGKLIVVGSFLAGGAGKTPFCIWLAEELRAGRYAGLPRLQRDSPHSGTSHTKEQVPKCVAAGSEPGMTNMQIEATPQHVMAAKAAISQQKDSGSVPGMTKEEPRVAATSETRVAQGEPRVAILCHEKAKDEAALLQWRLPFAKVFTTDNRYRTAHELDQQFDYIICDDGFEDTRLIGAYTIRLDWGKAPTRIRDLLPAGKCRSLLQDHPAPDEVYYCNETRGTSRDATTPDARGTNSAARGTMPASGDPMNSGAEHPTNCAEPPTTHHINFFISDVTNCAGNHLTRENIVTRGDVQTRESGPSRDALPNALPFGKVTRVSAICGIGNPYRFFRDLEAAGIFCERRIVLPDHAPDFEQTLVRVLRTAPAVVITEKDWIKLRESLRRDPRIFVARQSLSVLS